MMPVNLFVVRHGESLGNQAKRKSEQGDQSLLEKLRKTHTAHWPLTDKGVEQAKKAGAFLNEYFNRERITPERMMVSSYARAMETAGHLDVRDAFWSIDTRLTERDWGELDCLSDEERLSRFGDAIHMRKIEPFFWRPPEGESFKDLIIRIRDVVDSIFRADVATCVIVCHGEVMKALRIIFLGMTPGEYAEMEFSRDPLKRIHNCQIDHYSRKDPKTFTVAKRLEWLQVYRPAEGMDIAINWMKIPKRHFSNADLLTKARHLGLKVTLEE